MASKKIHLRILPKAQRTLWAKLAGAKVLSSFYLAGGTALALRLEHRESIDFGIFTQGALPDEELIEELRALDTVEVLENSPGTLHVLAAGVKTSYFQHKHPLITSPDTSTGITIADISDIALMKLIAISQRGAKKDFVDLHAILREGWNLQVLFDLLPKKFPRVAYNKAYLLKSLIWFADADSDPDPKLRAGVSWEIVKRELEFEAQKLL